MFLCTDEDDLSNVVIDDSALSLYLETWQALLTIQLLELSSSFALHMDCMDLKLHCINEVTFL
jgi:hypothetical protein